MKREGALVEVRLPDGKVHLASRELLAERLRRSRDVERDLYGRRPGQPLPILDGHSWEVVLATRG